MYLITCNIVYVHVISCFWKEVTILTCFIVICTNITCNAEVHQTAQLASLAPLYGSVFIFRARQARCCANIIFLRSPSLLLKCVASLQTFDHGTSLNYPSLISTQQPTCRQIMIGRTDWILYTLVPCIFLRQRPNEHHFRLELEYRLVDSQWYANNPPCACVQLCISCTAHDLPLWHRWVTYSERRQLHKTDLKALKHCL